MSLSLSLSLSLYIYIYTQTTHSMFGLNIHLCPRAPAPVSRISAEYRELEKEDPLLKELYLYISLSLYIYIYTHMFNIHYIYIYT